jgi:long-chain acyl-CoA synthetase
MVASKRPLWALGRVGVDIPRDPAPEKTLADIFERCERLYRTVVALEAPHLKPAVVMTYGELLDQARAFGAGLSRLGIPVGSKVALFSDNRPRWIISDLALLMTGLVEVPRGSDTSTPEFEYIIQHSEAKTLIIQDDRLLQRFDEAGLLSMVERVITLDDSQPELKHQGPAVFPMSQIIEQGREALHLFQERREALTPSDLATIVYTSGTTGGPKGVMLTHRNLSSQMDSVDVGLGETVTAGAKVLSILPTWHAYERVAEYFLFNMGCTIVYTDKRYIKSDLEKVKPEIFPCVPRIWETVYDAIQDKLSKAPPFRRKMFHFFYGLGLSYVRARRIAFGEIIRKAVDEPTSGVVIAASIKEKLLRPLYRLGDKVVFSKLRAAVSGGRLKAAVSGGGSFAPYLDDFFEVVGVPLLNGYGLTETSPVLTCRRIDWNVRGTVGLPIRGTEIQIRSENGEILPVGTPGIIYGRGPQVMMGYYKNPEATSKVLSEDGWLNTGDIGYITFDGDIVITGRAKDTIVLSSGENVEPEPIENVARKSPLITQILVVGQDQKTLGALVVPNYVALAEKLGLDPSTSHSDIVTHSQASKAIHQEITDALKSDGGFKASEFIAKVALLSEPFTEESGLLTQTMKIRRNKVAERYEDLISKLFA